MKRSKKVLAVLMAVLTAAAAVSACSSSGGSQSGSGGGEAPAGQASGGDEGLVDLNAASLDEIIEKAKAEGRVESVGMPDSWANWGLSWQGLKDEYGIDHADADMSSAEELQMFKTEGKNGTKDIGDVGFAFGGQAVSEDLVQGYKTSY